MSRTRQQANAYKRSRATHEPPIPLSAEARAVWDTTLASVTADHFALADLLMVATYCRACAVLDGLHERVAADPGADLPLLKIWKDTLATVTGMAAKLRLVPSSRNARRDGSVDPLPAGGYGPGYFGEDFLGGG